MAQPDFRLLDQNLPAEAAIAPIKGAGAVNALQSQLLQNQAANMEIQNALAEREAYKEAADTGMGVQQSLLQRGLGKQAAAYGKSMAEAQKLGTEGQLKKLELERERFGNLRFNPSDQNVIAHLQDSILRGEVTPQNAQQLFAKIAPMNEQQRIQYFTQMGMSAEKAQGLLLREREANTAEQRLAFETSPTRQAAIAQAKSAGTETGKTAAKVAADLPGAIEAAERGIALIDEMVGKAPVVDPKTGKVIEAGTKPHAGFSSYVGGTVYPGARFIEGSDTASFELRQKQIEGQAFLEAFRTLKGGGSITEKEGEKATAALSRMNKAASEKEYMEAAREVQDVLRAGIRNAKEKATRSVVPTTGGTAVSNTPAGNAYNQWLQQQQQ